MNIEEYKRRIDTMHTVTGVPTYWEELQKMTAERDLWKRGVMHLIEIEDCSQTNCEICAEVFSAYEQVVRGGQ
jgi:hypothetical protein